MKKYPQYVLAGREKVEALYDRVWKKHLAGKDTLLIAREENISTLRVSAIVGQRTKKRSCVKERNILIWNDYLAGKDFPTLAEKYEVSVSTINGIISNRRRMAMKTSKSPWEVFPRTLANRKDWLYPDY